MKKSIVYLGAALVAFTNVSLASNFSTSNSGKSRTEFKSFTTTPLCIAISKGDTESVKKFIEYGTDVNQLSDSMTPLMMAARYNKTEIIKLLISKGADLSRKDENGFTALKHAELSNATEAIQLLKEK